MIARALLLLPCVCGLSFEDFLVKFRKAYSAEEKLRRAKIYAANLAFIEAENQKNLSYRLGINKFSDQTSKEFWLERECVLDGNHTWSSHYLGRHHYSGTALPDSVDWVSAGAVNAVENQGGCGSCWAFSATGALEGAWQIASGTLLNLSESQLVDCDTASTGCVGGYPEKAFAHLQSAGSCTEQSYPYQASQSTCHESRCSIGIPSGSITGYEDVAQDTESIMEAVSQQPVSVGLYVEKNGPIQLYDGGIISGDCGDGTKANHAVLIVGYGTTEDGMDYWTLKNSWGSDWGEYGYFRVERGVTGQGECLIKQSPSYPTVQASKSQIII